MYVCVLYGVQTKPYFGWGVQIGKKAIKAKFLFLMLNILSTILNFIANTGHGVYIIIEIL